MTRPLDIRLDGGMPCCPRCGQQALMTADVPYRWGNPGAAPTRGTVPAVLCAKCDHGDSAAGPLIMYLLVHEQIMAETLRECAGLIQRWADSLCVPPVSLPLLENEILAWERGEL